MMPGPEIEPEQGRSVLSADILAQAADLDASGASTVTGTGEGGAVTVAAVTPEKVASDVSGLIIVAVKFLTPFYPTLQNVWTDDTCKAVAAATAPVLIKHDWVPDFGQWGEEIMLAIVLAPLISPTADALKLKKDKPNDQGKGAQAGAFNAGGHVKPAGTESAGSTATDTGTLKPASTDPLAAI